MRLKKSILSLNKINKRRFTCHNEMEQDLQGLVQALGWAVVVVRETRAVDEWEETALAQVQQVTVFAQTVGRRSPTALEHPVTR
jgi:hypothetical protein